MTAIRNNRKLTRRIALVTFAVAFLAMADRASVAAVSEIPSGRSDLAVVLIEGQLQGGETLMLEGLVSKLPANKSVAVILNSPGGSLGEGLKLGRFFHETRIPTFVLGHGGFCYSACALAFLGGRDWDGRPSRTKMSDGGLGFHQFRTPRSPQEATKKFTKTDMEQAVLVARAIAFQLVQYLSDIGEDMSLLHLMMKSPAAEMTPLSNEEAVTHGFHVMDERSEQVIDSSSIRARIKDR